MRLLPAMLAVAACATEPTLIGKLCSGDRPCPAGLFCDPTGICVEELEVRQTLSLITEGPGAGIVSSAPAGLRCEKSCSVDFTAGSSVTLTAHPVAGSGFAGWRGACTGRGSCVVSMSDARSVTAVFGLETGQTWVARFGGPADDRIVAIDVDLAGDPIAAGHFGSTAEFGDRRATSAGGLDGFIAKVRRTSQVDWVSTYGGSNDDAAIAVTTSIDSKVLAGGWFFGPAELFGEPHAGAGGSDPLLARLDATGARELALDLGSSGVDTSESVVFDDQGGAWVAGWITGPLTAGGITRGHVGGTDAYLVHYQRDGEADVVEVFGSGGNERALAIDRSPSGDRIALFGTFQGSLALGGAPVTSTTGYGLFVALFDGAGEHVWSRGFTAGSTEPFVTGRFDPAGDLVLAGGFRGAVHFGDRERSSAGDLDGFVAKLSGTGVLLWAKTFGGAEADGFFDVRVDGHGNTVLGGGFHGRVDFGGEPLTSAGGWDAALVKLDPGGEHVWSRRFGGPELDVILGVGLDVTGGVVAGGHFGGTVDFGMNLLTSAGSQDAFVVAVGR